MYLVVINCIIITSTHIIYVTGVVTHCYLMYSIMSRSSNDIVLCFSFLTHWPCHQPLLHGSKFLYLLLSDVIKSAYSITLPIFFTFTYYYYTVFIVIVPVVIDEVAAELQRILTHLRSRFADSCCLCYIILFTVL